MPAKKLYKSKVGKKIDGVCTGLSIYLGIDVALIRLLFIILTFISGYGIIGYIVCAAIMPNEPETIDYTYYNKDEQNHN